MSAVAETGARAENKENESDEVTSVDEEGSTDENSHHEELFEKDKQRHDINDDEDSDHDYLADEDWLNKDNHIFILSSSGKPIYSRYGNDDTLAPLFGIIQVMTYGVQDIGQSIQSIKAGNFNFCFLSKGDLILVSASKTGAPTTYLELQLNYVYNQIISVLTAAQVEGIFKQRRNFDLRRLLGGNEIFIEGLLQSMTQDFSYILNAVKTLPLPENHRNAASQSLLSNRSKDTFFSILLARGQLVSYIRPKSSNFDATDIHLIQNLVSVSKSFRSSGEFWVPICLPRFQDQGFLYGHLSYLDDDFDICLIIFSPDKEMSTFDELSAHRAKILKHYEDNNVIEAIQHSLRQKYTIDDIATVGLKHFIFKSKKIAQWTAPEMEDETESFSLKKRLFRAYQNIYEKSERNGEETYRIFHSVSATEILFYWNAPSFVLFAVFSPFLPKNKVILSINAIVRWMKQNDDLLFLQNPLTF